MSKDNHNRLMAVHLTRVSETIFDLSQGVAGLPDEEDLQNATIFIENFFFDNKQAEDIAKKLVDESRKVYDPPISMIFCNHHSMIIFLHHLKSIVDLYERHGVELTPEVIEVVVGMKDYLTEIVDT